MKINSAAIIDDDPIFIFGTKKLMSILNFCEDVQVYNNGQEAIEALKGGAMPDLIFLDLNMPVMDGWQFLEEYRNLSSAHQPIIYIVSSSIDPADIAKAKEFDNVSDYVIKPVTKSRLQEIMQDLSGRNSI